MQVKREHLAGLELALAIADTVCTDSISVVQLKALIEQAKVASVEEYGAEAVVVVGYLLKSHSGVYSQTPGDEWEPLMTVAQHHRLSARQVLILAFALKRRNDAQSLLRECLNGLAPWPDLGDRIRALLKAQQ